MGLNFHYFPNGFFYAVCVSSRFVYPQPNCFASHLILLKFSLLRVREEGGRWSISLQILLEVALEFFVTKLPILRSNGKLQLSKNILIRITDKEKIAVSGEFWRNTVELQLVQDFHRFCNFFPIFGQNPKLSFLLSNPNFILGCFESIISSNTTIYHAIQR